MTVNLVYTIHSFEGIRLFFDNKASDADEARALSYQTDHIDIYSNSWGPDINGFKVIGPGPLTQRALQSGAEKVIFEVINLTELE